jgi:hypothetical protein
MFTIQQVIIENLLKYETKTISNKKVKVGLSYDEILKQVHHECKTNELLPNECNTSKECISWYASKMKNESTKYYNKEILDIVRPRKSNKKQTKVVTTK